MSSPPVMARILEPIVLYLRSMISTPQLYSRSSKYSVFPDQIPSPSKVLVILEELGSPYETSWVELENLEKKPFENANPNGHVPGR